MTATQTQIRRGTESQCNAMTPVEGEVIADLTNDRLRLGDGVTLGGIVQASAADIRQNAFIFATAGGSANALTATISPVPASYSQPLSVKVKATATNTGATTINVNGLGTKNIYKLKSGVLVPLEANDIISGVIYDLVYDGTQFQLSGMGGSAEAGGYELLDVVSFGSFYNEFAVDATYDHYMFVFKNSGPSSTSHLLMQLEVSSSWASSGYISSLGAAGSSIQLSSAQVGVWGNGVSGRVYLDASQGYPTVRGDLVEIYRASSGGTASLVQHSSMGARNVSGSTTGVRFYFTSAGATFIGTISQYGLRKSL